MKIDVNVLENGNISVSLDDGCRDGYFDFSPTNYYEPGMVNYSYMVYNLCERVVLSFLGGYIRTENINEFHDLTEELFEQVCAAINYSFGEDVI